MKVFRYTSLTILTSGAIISIFNYLWLLGIMDKPAPDLFEARWVYTVVSLFVGGFLYGISREFEE